MKMDVVQQSRDSWESLIHVGGIGLLGTLREQEIMQNGGVCETAAHH
jgi:hypothetical protein